MKVRNILVIFFIFICSCSEGTMRNIGRNYLPNKAVGSFEKQLREATPEFRRGWYDGCETGISVASVNIFYRMFYTNNRVDGYAKANDAEYRTGWGEAVGYCMRYEEIKQASSLWGSVFGGYR